MTAAEVFGSLSPLDVARQVARYALGRLDEVDPTFAADMRAMAKAVGQGYWLDPAPEVDGEVVTASQLAAEVGVKAPAVSLWVSRGISDGGGGRVYLAKRSDGRFDRRDVDDFLRVRDGGPVTTVIPTPEFCACGHDRELHQDMNGACTAHLPDDCSCLGWRAPRKR